MGVFFIQAIQLSEAGQTSFEVGTGLMAFDYVEYDDNNVFLDGESGILPGVIAKLKTNERVYYELEGSVYYNKIEYDGQTQGGTPVITTSDALIIDTHFKVGLNFEPSYGREQKIYAGLGYRYWYRNINSGQDVLGNPVSGLLEEYSWYYALAGYAVHFSASNNVKVGLDFRFTRMFNAKIDVDHLGFRGYDNQVLNLGNRSGARFAIPVGIKLSSSTLIIAPFYEIIDIGKSNSVTLTQNGGTPAPGTECGGNVLDICILSEPRSETRNVGIEVTWLW